MWQIIFGFIFGSILGSFSAATAYRLIKRRSLKGRSVCEGCKKPIKWFDLFPLVSYLLLKGRCRSCGKKISVESWIIEIVTGLLIALLFYQTLPSNLTTPGVDNFLLMLSVLFKTFSVVVLVIVFLVDLKTGYIYDKVTYPAIWVAAGYHILSSTISSVEFYQRIKALPIGTYLMPPHSSYLTDHIFYIWEGALWALIAGVGAALFFVLLILATKGKGMGWGDVKFVLFLGLVLNFPKIILGVFLAFLSGSLISIALILIGRKKLGQTIPFGPFLALGALTVMFWGDPLLNWYSWVLTR